MALYTENEHGYEFTVADRKGAEHHYQCSWHTTDEAMDLSGEIASHLGPAVVSGIVSAVSAGGLGDIDANALIKALPDLGASIRGVVNAKLARRLLANATRDGKPLENGAHYDRAYARGGNVFEAMKAALVICIASDFFMGLSDSIGSAQALEMKDALALALGGLGVNSTAPDGPDETAGSGA